MHRNLLAATLDALTIGAPVIVDNLAMLPLLQSPIGNPNPSIGNPDSAIANRNSAVANRKSPIDSRHSVNLHSAIGNRQCLDYAVLDDALAEGLVEITEVSQEGVVPELRFVNRGAAPVLVVDGEELLGAKQNRVVNLTLLVPAHSALTIPVSCVEAGRWRARSRSFTAAPRAQYASGRAKRMAHVSYSMAMTGDRRSNQADIWDDIAEKSMRLEASSPTAAMEAIYTTHERSVDAFVHGMLPLDGQVGAVFAIDDRIVGFDLFDRASTLRKMLPKLVRSAAIDAIDCAAAQRRGGRGVPRGSANLPAQASRFLAVTARIDPETHPALGLGEDARLSAPRLTGAALVVDEQVVHLGAFAL